MIMFTPGAAVYVPLSWPRHPAAMYAEEFVLRFGFGGEDVFVSGTTALLAPIHQEEQCS